MKTDLILCRILFIKWNKNYTFMSQITWNIICQKLKFNVSRTPKICNLTQQGKYFFLWNAKSSYQHPRVCQLCFTHWKAYWLCSEPSKKNSVSCQNQDKIQVWLRVHYWWEILACNLNIWETCPICWKGQYVVEARKVHPVLFSSAFHFSSFCCLIVWISHFHTLQF